MSTPLIAARGLVKDYGTKKNPTRALGPVDIDIPQGSYTVILGKSGSGKSTLLNLIAGLDKPSAGQIIVNEKDIAKLSQKRLARYRSEIGIIFQFYNLLPNLSTIENVMMGGWAGGSNPKNEKAKELLTNLGLEHRVKANIKTLSGGEKQRVAIARALINDPHILFCDEPTGALDSKNEMQVKEILDFLNEQGITIVMVTHNEEFVKKADQVIFLQDGQVTPYEPPTKHKHPLRRSSDKKASGEQKKIKLPALDYDSTNPRPSAHKTIINP